MTQTLTVTEMVGEKVAELVIGRVENGKDNKLKEAKELIKLVGRVQRRLMPVALYAPELLPTYAYKVAEEEYYKVVAEGKLRAGSNVINIIKFLAIASVMAVVTVWVLANIFQNINTSNLDNTTAQVIRNIQTGTFNVFNMLPVVFLVMIAGAIIGLLFAYFGA